MWISRDRLVASYLFESESESSVAYLSSDTSDEEEGTVQDNPVNPEEGPTLKTIQNKKEESKNDIELLNMLNEVQNRLDRIKTHLSHLLRTSLFQSIHWMS